MGLSARQQRDLDNIESALEAGDPCMTAIFAMFTRLTRGEELASAERLPRRRQPRRHQPRRRQPRRRQPRWRGALAILPVAAVMAFVAGVMIAVATGSAPVCARGALAAPAQPRSAANCRARPSTTPGQMGPDGYAVFPASAGAKL